MSVRGVDFLRDWIAKNVTADDKGETRATILATQCVLEAAQRGIAVAHMEEGGHSVESVIMHAIARHPAGS